jgi:NADH:ubiquinone oxidoreductase subunit
MGLLRALFIWWRDATAGTLVTTWLTGVFVGRDAYGNRYYRSRKGGRRWVLYKDIVDGSKVPAEWHGWLHRTIELPPVDSVRKPWEKGHMPNLSGTSAAYYPSGSLMRGGRRISARGDYEPWSP